MTFAVTAGPTNNSGQSVTLNGCTAGNSIVVGVWFYDASVTINNIQISSGEANATLHGSINRDASQSNSSFQLASLGLVTASGNKTITAFLSGSPSFDGGIVAVEVSGGNTGSFFDQVAAAAGLTAPGTGDFSINVSSTNANAFIFSFAEVNGSEPGAGSGYTTFPLPNTGNQLAGEYKVDAGAAGTQSVAYTTSVGLAAYHVIAGTFNVASVATVVRGIGTAR